MSATVSRAPSRSTSTYPTFSILRRYVGSTSGPTWVGLPWKVKLPLGHGSDGGFGHVGRSRVAWASSSTVNRPSGAARVGRAAAGAAGGAGGCCDATGAVGDEMAGASGAVGPTAGAGAGPW